MKEPEDEQYPDEEVRFILKSALISIAVALGFLMTVFYVAEKVIEWTR